MSYNARVKTKQSRVNRPIAQIPQYSTPSNINFSPFQVNRSQGWEVGSSQANAIGIPSGLNRKIRIGTNTIIQDSPDSRVRKDSRGLVTYQTQKFGVGSMFRHGKACFGGFGMEGECKIPDNKFLPTPNVIMPNCQLLCNNCPGGYSAIFNINLKNDLQFNGTYYLTNFNQSDINKIYYSPQSQYYIYFYQNKWIISDSLYSTNSIPSIKAFSYYCPNNNTYFCTDYNNPFFLIWQYGNSPYNKIDNFPIINFVNEKSCIPEPVPEPEPKQSTYNLGMKFNLIAQGNYTSLPVDPISQTTWNVWNGTTNTLQTSVYNITELSEGRYGFKLDNNPYSSLQTGVIDTFSGGPTPNPNGPNVVVDWSSDFTIAYWVKLNPDNSKWRTLNRFYPFGQGAHFPAFLPGQDDIIFWINAWQHGQGAQYPNYQDSNGNNVSFANETGVWKLIITTVEQTNSKLYLGHDTGAPVYKGEATRYQSGNIFTGTQYIWQIGHPRGNPGDGPGLVGQVSYWDRLLSTDEINQYWIDTKVNT